MRRAAALVRTTVGLKAGMAVSGLILFAFIVGHLAGNLKVFMGPEHFNAYAEGLRTVGAPFFARGQLLWIARIILLVSLVVHVGSAIALTRRSLKARPVGYRNTPHLESTYASRTMRWGGVIIFLYVIYHLMQFTWGTIHPHFIPGDAYYNLVVGFQSRPVVGIYLVAMTVLGFHLYHGLWSALQTLGQNNPLYARWRRPVALVVAVGLAVGFAIIPLAVQAGVLHL